MANKIIHKRSSVPNKIPLSTDLSLGEVAINTNDGKVFMKKGDNTIHEVGLNNGKNLIINGDFSVWQRGTSLTINDGQPYYLADRWYMYSSYSGGSSLSTRETFPEGTAARVDGNPNYYLKYMVTGTGPNGHLVEHRIENVSQFTGKTLSFSVWLKGEGGNTSVSVRFTTKVGTGGSGDNNEYNETVSLTNSWVKHTMTFTVSDYVGKTINQDDSYFFIRFDLGTGTVNQGISIASAQLEYGNEPTEFEIVDPATQLMRCQRYFERIGGVTNQMIGNGFFQTDTDSRVVFNYSKKRSIPALSVNRQDAIAVIYSGGGYSTSTAINFSTSSIVSSVILITTGTSGTTNYPNEIRLKLDTDYIDIDAEL